MERQLKQRVVGAAVLVVLGVIFIPLFLDDGAVDRAASPTLELPAAPADDLSPALPLDDATVEALHGHIDGPLPEPPPAPAADGAAAMIDAPAVEDVSPAGTSPAASTPPAPAPTNTPPAEAPARAAPAPAAAPAARPSPPPAPAVVAGKDAWAVQLGSFSSQANAERLRAALSEGGRRAYVEPRQEAGATVYKVRVGPLASRAEAERVRAELEARHATRGMLLPYR